MTGLTAAKRRNSGMATAARILARIEVSGSVAGGDGSTHRGRKSRLAVTGKTFDLTP